MSNKLHKALRYLTSLPKAGDGGLACSANSCMSESEHAEARALVDLSPREHAAAEIREKCAATTSAGAQLSSLDVALDALTRFPYLHLFPIFPENKAQPLLKDYLKRASNDPARIRRWHSYWKARFGGKECWWGVAPELSGLVFADVDTKVGKRGQETFQLLDLLYGWPSTLVVGSPSGGRHHWYRGRHLFALGTDRSNHPGIDFAQYVILPGCMRADGTGYTLKVDCLIAEAPVWFYAVTRRSVDNRATVKQEPVIAFDHTTNVDWARDYLQHDAPRSITGQGGEQTTLEVATVLKDYGISEAMALELMAEFYNVPDKCDPIWSMDESPPEDSLPIKVHNAFSYKRNAAPGALCAKVEFAGDEIEIAPLDSKTAAKVAQQKIKRANLKADKANGVVRRRTPRMDKLRRKALQRAAAMAMPYRSK